MEPGSGLWPRLLSASLAAVEGSALSDAFLSTLGCFGTADLIGVLGGALSGAIAAVTPRLLPIRVAVGPREVAVAAGGGGGDGGCNGLVLVSGGLLGGVSTPRRPPFSVSVGPSDGCVDRTGSAGGFSGGVLGGVAEVTPRRDPVSVSTGPSEVLMVAS